MIGKTIPALLCSLLLCGASAAVPNTRNTGITMEQSKPHITASTVENTNNRTPLVSRIENMNLTGYVGTNIKNNVKFWQTNAYRNNRNIIEQIARAKDNTAGFETILGTDFFGVDSYFDIDIAERDGGKAIGWTLTSVPVAFGDRDIRYAAGGTAVTDWTGARELWLKVDASEITSPVGIRMAFEENTVGRESYRFKPSMSVTLYDGNMTSATSDSEGYVFVPAMFDGYIAFPLDNASYERYFSDSGNGVLDISNVVQFQLSVKADSGALDKTLYMDEFAVVGLVGGVTPPVDGVSGTYKVIWDLSALTQKTQTNSSSLYWYGEFAGKLLTGMAYSYKIYPDAALKAAADEIVEDLGKAQGDDGYLGVFTGGARFSLAVFNWDLWNHYHCITGLLEWNKVTGNARALEIAKKAIDLIYDTFKDRSYIVVGGFETNRGIAHGFAQMYQATGDGKYLREAERIITNDCMDDNGWYKTALRLFGMTSADFVILSDSEGSHRLSCSLSLRCYCHAPYP